MAADCHVPIARFKKAVYRCDGDVGAHSAAEAEAGVGAVGLDGLSKCLQPSVARKAVANLVRILCLLKCLA